MPLRKFSDEEFDNLVRTRFESAPLPAYDPAAWSKFNLKKQKASWIPKAVYTGIIILILFLGGLFISNSTKFGGNEDAYSLSKQSSLDIHDEVSQNDLSNNENKAALVTGLSSDIESSKSYDSQETVVNHENNNSTPGKKEFATNVISESNTDSNQQQAVLTNTGNNKVTQITSSQVEIEENLNKSFHQEQETDQNTILIEDLADNQSITKGTLNADEQVPQLVLVSSISEDNNIPPKDFEEEATFLLVDPEFVEIAESPVVPEEKKKLNSRFTLGLVLNTDLTTVNLKNFTGPGSGIGLRGSFQFTDRVSLVTGVNRVNKVYLVTDEGDVTLPPGVWDNNNFPDQIDAKCTVIEIPINLRFDLIKLPKGRIYGLAGLNSFLMNREFYEWQVGGGQYGAVTNDIEFRKENKHYFGVLNLSAGYQRRVGEHFSWGIESYYQSTLAGVGFYEISLKSLGNQILLNYHF